MLRVENLHFAYGKKVILDDINFHLKAGEFVGIVGANGCGKSTLFKNILGVLKSKANIEIDGKNLRDFTQIELAKIIGYIPQKSALTMPLKVSEYILLGLFSHNAFSGYKDCAMLDSILERLDILQLKNRNVLSLSGGEFCKVNLARAIIKKPKILLLDEPTAALDLQYAIFLMQMCKKLSSEGVLVLVIIHDLNLASKFCTRLIALKNSRIYKDCESALLINQKDLKELFELECEIVSHKNRKIIIY